VVDRLLGANRAELEAGEKREMTVYFSDVQGFSAISETLTPTALVRLVNRYLTLAAEPIHRHHGVIDKYIGDAVMAYWGPPFALEEPALSAVIAALEQREQIARLQRNCPNCSACAGVRPAFRRGSASPRATWWSARSVRPPRAISRSWAMRSTSPRASKAPTRPMAR
jgi:class 3 adenylate cyclase